MSSNSRTNKPGLERAARALGQGARRKRSDHDKPLLPDVTISTTATSSSDDLSQQIGAIQRVSRDSVRGVKLMNGFNFPSKKISITW